MSATDTTNDPTLEDPPADTEKAEAETTAGTVDLTKADVDSGVVADEPDVSTPVSGVGARVNVIAALVLVIAVAVAVVAGLVWNRLSDNDAADSRSADAVVTAKRVVVDLTTLNHSDVKASVNRILAETTGDFRNQFANSSGAFQSALAQGQVDSVGRTDSAGLIKADASSAQVLVASSSTVKNTQAPQGDPRVYRMKVSLQRSGDKWLVSNVEFVS